MSMELRTLYSTRNDDGRAIHVTVENRGEAATAVLIFSICDEQHRQSLPLEAGESREVTQPHGQTGLCNVTVVEETSGERKTRYLDLDQPKSD